MEKAKNKNVKKTKIKKYENKFLGRNVIKFVKKLDPNDFIKKEK